MDFGFNAIPAIDLLREQLLKLLELARGGRADLTQSKIPFSVFLPGFGVNQAALTDNHLNTLAELAETLLTDPALEIDILVGRASQTGNESNNLSLSEARAQAVLDELDALVIYSPPPIVGLGSSQPIAEMPNKESELNRSVEIRLWYDLAHHFSGVKGPTPGSAHPVEIKTYESAWDKGFQNLTDQELEETWTQIHDDNLNDFENSRFHGYFVGTIVNVALERGRRERTGGTLREKVYKAWNDVQIQLREDQNKADRSNTIYRDVERIAEVAHDTLGSTASGMDMVLGQVVFYDPGKLAAWFVYDSVGNDWLLRKAATTDDYPTRAGGLEWTLVGFNYAVLYKDLSDPPMLPLQTGSRELVQQELIGP